MAEKKEFNKKWLIVIAILVLLAIIVVTIILCLPGNPKSAVQALQKDKDNNIFKDEKVVQSYDNFEIKMASSNGNYSLEMEEVQILIEDLAVVVDKYSGYALYFEENQNFFDNYKPVTTSLNEIQNLKQNIVDELENVEKNYNENSKDFLRNSWIKIRTNVKDILYNYSQAFSSLLKIFEGSYFGLEQNLASYIAFSTINDYVKVLYSDFEFLSTEDLATSSINNYNYTFSAVMNGFNQFITKFEGTVSGYSYDISSFYFDKSIENKYQNIKTFYTEYNEQNFQAIIESAKISNGKVTFTKVYDQEDENGVYELVKNYLGGI